nr:glycine cleavage system aminomethyltransferase GcvT [Lacticigenium naphthae]
MADTELEDLKKTPLYPVYQEQQIRLTDFGGWALPIQFTGIMDEHKAVRTKAGLFDVSHMGEIFVMGPNATDWLNGLVTNDVTKMEVDQAQYNAVCKEDGGTLDDLIVFKYSNERYLVTPNASNSEKIFNWFQQHASESVKIENCSDRYGLLALQGPASATILRSLTEAPFESLSSYTFLPEATIAGISGILLSRTGYTGEDGFELYLKAEDVPALWKALLDNGEAYGIQPCGLGARDTLRLEAGMALYGHELSEDVTPLEGGIGFAVKTTKEADFIGKEALASQRKAGLEIVSRGFELLDKGIAREGYTIVDTEGEEIGTVTSGTKSPTLDKVIGMARLKKAYAKVGTEIVIQIRKKEAKAKIIKKPFYKKENREGQKE